MVERGKFKHSNSESRFLPNSAMSESEKRGKYGCVMRSLESFFGTEATDGEWRFRINRAVEVLHLMDEANQLSNPELIHARQKQIVEADMEEVRGFITALADNPTPLGQAIKNTNLVYSEKNAADVYRAARSGNDLLVMYSYDVEDPNYKHVGHMAHVKYDWMRGIYSASDDKKIKPMDSMYRVFERSN